MTWTVAIIGRHKGPSIMRKRKPKKKNKVMLVKSWKYLYHTQSVTILTVHLRTTACLTKVSCAVLFK